VEKQNSNTRHLLFKIPTLIADISAAMTLEPGDIIATGTPAGVGAGRTPRSGCGPATWSRPASKASAPCATRWSTARASRARPER
jgi:2-keto-4-pentenoate hydratase/2-oxohepta-3-ene-1,7-dioic acid hydratase in catechol pathway